MPGHESGEAMHQVNHSRPPNRVTRRRRAGEDPAQDSTFRRDHHLFRALRAELDVAGCFRAAPARAMGYGALIVGVYSAAYATLLADPDIALWLCAVVALLFANVHAGILAHEAGHGALTRNRRIAVAFGQVFNTLLTALCYSHFQHIHRAHHPHCNDRDRDPDMQSGVFSMYTESARQKRGLGGWISRHQAVLIWILVWLQGFTLKIDSLQHLRRNPDTTRADHVLVTLHYLIWFIPPVLILGPTAALTNYLVMTLLIGPYLGVIFLVNHIGTRVIEPDEQLSHFEHEIAVTRNLGDSRLHDLLFGGLNHHIEHHLFPTMPTARLRSARKITRAFCECHGIAYREMSWFAAVGEVTRHFKAMSAIVPR